MAHCLPALNFFYKEQSLWPLKRYIHLLSTLLTVHTYMKGAARGLLFLSLSPPPQNWEVFNKTAIQQYVHFMPMVSCNCPTYTGFAILCRISLTFSMLHLLIIFFCNLDEMQLLFFVFRKNDENLYTFILENVFSPISQ